VPEEADLRPDWFEHDVEQSTGKPRGAFLRVRAEGCLDGALLE
jgi:ribosomal protein S27E